MLRGKVHRVAVVARGRVVRLRLCVGLSPSAAPLAAGLGALRPLRPRPPVAVDRARLLVARVNLHIKVAMSYYFPAPNVDKTQGCVSSFSKELSSQLQFLGHLELQFSSSSFQGLHELSYSSVQFH